MSTPTVILRDTANYTTIDNEPLEVVLAYYYPNNAAAVSGNCVSFCEAQHVSAAGVSYKQYTDLSAITSLTLSEFLAARDGIKPDKHPSIPA